MKITKEVLPARSWTLELVAIAAAIAALSFLASGCTTDPDETSCAHFEAQRADGTITPSSERTEIEYAPFPALWGDVFPLHDQAGHYIGLFARSAFELRVGHTVRRGTVLVTGADQCEWFDAIN